MELRYIIVSVEEQVTAKEVEEANKVEEEEGEQEEIFIHVEGEENEGNGGFNSTG